MQSTHSQLLISILITSPVARIKQLNICNDLNTLRYVEVSVHLCAKVVTFVNSGHKHKTNLFYLENQSFISQGWPTLKLKIETLKHFLFIHEINRLVMRMDEISKLLKKSVLDKDINPGKIPSITLGKSVDYHNIANTKYLKYIIYIIFYK